MKETGLLEELRERLGLPARRELILGPGDDCAIYRPAGAREDLLFTTDFFIEGVHFTRPRYKAVEAGQAALSRGLSDIAAMGGEPRFCLVSLAVTADAGPEWFREFMSGVIAVGLFNGAPLAGGDTAASGRITADIVVCGGVPKGKALRRDGARPGHDIFVSGKLGGAARALQRGKPWLFQPRLALGQFLRGRASAAMDLSDGLSLDLHRLCFASRVSAEIEPPPRASGATLSQALHGGEDYELLFTAPPGVEIPAKFENIPLTRIGRVVKGRPGEVLLKGKPLEPLGFDHFRKS